MEEYGDAMKWTNAEHMLSDALTKHLLEPTQMIDFMRKMVHGFIVTRRRRED